MPSEDQGDVTPRREWIALTATNLKASGGLAHALADHEKLPAVEGGRLSAVVTSEDKDYWTIADGLLNGATVPDAIRFVYKGHWQLQPLAEPEAAAPAVKPAPAETKEAEVDTFLAESLLAEPVEPEPPLDEPAQAEAPEPEPEPAPAVVTPVPAPPVAAAKPLPEKDAPKAPNDRRLFASFRRRLSKK